jgi:antitoxin component of RelBE/YafQ-DinJ toxin-antitoxin module
MNKFIFSLATRSHQITQLMPLNEVVQEQPMLCEPLIPNAKTVKAMREARQRKTTKHKTIADLMANLHV